MLSYKESLFLSILDGYRLYENYNLETPSFLELLLEAPIEDFRVKKIIKDKKQVSIYYQGDDKLGKGWYPVQMMSIENRDGKKQIKAYVVPKSGEKPSIQFFDQSKVVNWNLVSNKPANLITGNSPGTTGDKTLDSPSVTKNMAEPDGDIKPEFEEKVLDFIKDTKIPKEKKQSLLQKLKDVGVNVARFLKKKGVAAGLMGAIIIGSFIGNFKTNYPHVAQLYNTKNLTTKDFNQDEIKVMGELIKNSIERTGNVNKGSVTYEDYPEEYSTYATKGAMFSTTGILRQVVSDPYMMCVATLGQFTYEKNEDGSYSVFDYYDFSKWKGIKTTKKDIKGMSYSQAIEKIMLDNKNVNLYIAIRHMAYLENPDTAPESQKKTVKVVVPSKYMSSFQIASK